MSILKALKDESTYYEGDAYATKANFQEGVQDYISVPTQDNLSYLVVLYAEYSYQYLRGIAHTFEGNPAMKETLSFMNSVIAEVCHEQEVPYFHAELGYSIVDKAVAARMENNSLTVVENAVGEAMQELFDAKARVDAEEVKRKEEEQALIDTIEGD